MLQLTFTICALERIFYGDNIKDSLVAMNMKLTGRGGEKCMSYFDFKAKKAFEMHFF
jgi:hypothetical protein